MKKLLTVFASTCICNCF